MFIWVHVCLTTVIGKPCWLEVERGADVEDVRVTALAQVGNAELGG